MTHERATQSESTSPNERAIVSERTKASERALLAAIDAPHFYAGIVLRDDKVIEVAPIVSYMMDWRRDQVRDYCRRKRWKVLVVRSEPS
jgi:hypothetical protein